MPSFRARSCSLRVMGLITENSSEAGEGTRSGLGPAQKSSRIGPAGKLLLKQSGPWILACCSFCPSSVTAHLFYCKFSKALFLVFWGGFLDLNITRRNKISQGKRPCWILTVPHPLLPGLCSLAAQQDLGIDTTQWLCMHGCADGDLNSPRGRPVLETFCAFL